VNIWQSDYGRTLAFFDLDDVRGVRHRHEPTPEGLLNHATDALIDGRWVVVHETLDAGEAYELFARLQSSWENVKRDRERGWDRAPA